MNNIINNSLSITFFPNSISDLFFIIFVSLISAIILFSFFYFVIKNITYKLYSLKNLTYKKKIIIQIFMGLIFSTLVVSIIFIGRAINSPLFIISQFFIIVIFSLFTSTISLIGVIPVFLIINILFVSNLDVSTIVFLFLFLSLSFLYVFINRFFFENNIKTILLTSPIYFGFLIALIAAFFYNNNFTNVLLNFLINVILFYLVYSLASVITNIVNNTYNLRTSVQYDDEFFIKTTYSLTAFEDYVKKNNIETGLIITFDIVGIERIITVEGKDFSEKIEKIFISYLVYAFGKDTFYFKTRDNKYAAFIKVDKHDINLPVSILGNENKQRQSNDFLYKFQQILDFIPKGIDFNKKTYELNIVGFSSIYGINSNDFLSLVDNNSKMKKNWKKDNNFNSLQLYELDNFSNINTKNLNKLIRKINLNSFNLKLVEIFGGKNFNKINNNFLSAFPTSILESIFNKNSLYTKFQDNPEDLNLIIRNFALRSLVLYSKFIENKNDNHKLILDYPIYELQKNNFSNYKIISKINQNNIPISNIIMNFNVKNIVIINKKIIEEIHLLKSEGMQIAFDYFDENNLVLLNQIKPDYVFVNNKYQKTNEDINHKKYLDKFIKFLELNKIGILFK